MPAPPRFVPQVRAILGKDLAIELARGELVTTAGFFAVLLVVLSSLSYYGGPRTGRQVAAGVIWLSVAFAAVLALGRAWQREREEDALGGLLATPLSRPALFLGKALGLALFVSVVEALVLPLTALFFNLDLVAHGPGLLTIAAVTTPGLAASATLFGSMTVRTRARDLVLGVVLFPLQAPALLGAVAATRDLLDGASLGELTGHLALLATYDLVFLAGGLALLGPLLDD